MKQRKEKKKEEEETMKMMGDVIRGRSLYLSFLSGAVNAGFRRGMPEGISNFRKKDSQTTQSKFWRDGLG